MIWAKKKKMLIVSGLLIVVLAVPQFASIPFYTRSKAPQIVNINGTNRVTDPNLIDGADASSQIDNSNRDQNLKELIPNKPKLPVVVVEPPKPIEPTIITPEPEPIPTPTPTPPVVVIPVAPVEPITPTVEPEVTQSPPVITPKPDENKPDVILPPSTGTLIPGPDEEVREVAVVLRVPDATIVTRLADGTIVRGGKKTITSVVKVVAKKPPKRHDFPASDREILNRIPYKSNIAPEIVNIEVTEEFINDLKTSYLASLKFDIDAGVGFETHYDAQGKPYKIDWKNRSSTPRDQIDWANIRITAEAVEKIKKGYTLNPANLYINVHGEIDSNSWGPISNTFNNTISLQHRDNKEKRYFSYDQWYARTPDSIQNGDFPGWTKTNVKEEWLKFGLTQTDGIEVTKYTNKDPAFQNKNNSIRVVLDAANQEGYEKYINFLKSVQKDPSKKIHSFVIKNMGVGGAGANQKFFGILEALPEDVPNLELWLENPSSTSFLYALRKKKIDELALYTTQNSWREEWSINPLSVQNTAYIQSQDYNVSHSFAEGYKPATKVNFHTMVFDPQNYDKTATTEAERFREINLGIRMAYYVRNNERFFQGPFGQGIEDPDNSEKTNTIWPGLDLSRIPQLKSLRGLSFDFGEGNKKFSRKLDKLTLYNDSSVFTISVDELNNSQFDKVMKYIGDPRGEPKNRLLFKGANVNAMRIVSNGKNLTAEGLLNLETFYRQVGKDVFGGREIYVNAGDEIINELKNNGYQTRPYARDIDIKLN